MPGCIRGAEMTGCHARYSGRSTRDAGMRDTRQAGIERRENGDGDDERRGGAEDRRISRPHLVETARHDWPARYAAASPIAVPTAASVRPCFSTSQKTLPGVAPSASGSRFLPGAAPPRRR